MKIINAGRYPQPFLYGVILFHQLITSMVYPIAKLGLNQLEPLTFAFYRFTISSLIYIPVIIILWSRPRINFRDHFKIAAIGLLIIFVNQVLFLVGQSKTLAGHSAVLFAMVPIFIYILAAIFLKERMTLRRSLGILIAFSGVYIILTGGKVHLGAEYFWGDIMVLSAVFAWACATVLLKPLTLKYGAFRTIGMALVYGSLAYFPFGLNRALNADYSQMTASGWFSVLFMAVGVSVGAYFIWYWVIKFMDVSRVAILQNIQPIVSTAAAAIMLSEPISTTFVIGGVIALSGVILTEIKQSTI